MPRLHTSQLAPTVERLVGFFTQSVMIANPTSRDSLRAFQQMLADDSVSSLSLLVRLLMITSSLDEYRNDNEGIQEECRSAIAGMRGSTRSLLYKLLSCIPFGSSFSEIVYRPGLPGSSAQQGATLAKIQPLNPTRFYFEGKVGEITNVVYIGTDGFEQDIPYSYGIHLVNDEHLLLDGSPYGIPAAARAYPYWELHKLTLAATAIAAERQATPILAGKTDTSANSVMLNSDGTPLLNPATGEPILVNQAASMRDQLMSVANNSVVVLDRLDELIAIQQQTDGQFFQWLLYYCANRRMEAFLTPSTLFGGTLTGVGDSSIAEQHQKIFMAVCRADAENLGEAIVEQVLRPMITFNHGEQPDYGHFPVKQDKDSQAVELLNAISGAVQRGLFTAEDEAVILRAKELAEID